METLDPFDFMRERGFNKVRPLDRDIAMSDAGSSHDDAHTVFVDLRGQSCPFPLISAMKKLEALVASGFGEARFLDLLVDCPPSIENIPLEMTKRGYRAEVEQTQPTEWRIRVHLDGKESKP